MDLTDEEKSVLFNYHTGKAKYWADCESTNKRLARKADPESEEVFGGGPHSGELRTPDGWMKRAHTFCRWKKERRERARLFK